MRLLRLLQAQLPTSFFTRELPQLRDCYHCARGHRPPGVLFIATIVSAGYFFRMPMDRAAHRDLIDHRDANPTSTLGNTVARDGIIAR